MEKWSAGYKIFGDLMQMENSHFQYTLEYLPEEHCSRVQNNMRVSFRDPLYEEFVDTWKFNTRESFRVVIEEIQREIASDSQS